MRASLVVLCLVAAAACSDDKRDGDEPTDGDALPLTIVQSLPSADAVDVEPSLATVTVTFSEALDAASLPPQLQLTRGELTTTVTPTVNGPLVSVTPNGSLGRGTRCTLTLPAGIRGKQGSELENDVVLAFTTATTSGVAQVDLYADELVRLRTGRQIGIDAAGNVIALWSTDADDMIVRRYAADTGSWSPADFMSSGEDATLSVAASGDAVASGRRFAGAYRNWASRYTNAGSWALAEQVSTQAESEGPADIVLANGVASAIFRAEVGGISHVRFGRASGAGWAPSQQISDTGALAGAPRIASDAAGNAWVAWSQSNLEGTFNTWAAYCPAGGSCGAASVIDDAEGDTSLTDLAMSPAGVALAFWLDTTGTARYWASVATGTSFGPPFPVSATGGLMTGGTAAVCGSGSAFIAWAQVDSATGRNDVWAARYSGGDMSTPELLEENTANTSAPRIGCDAVGNATVIWTQEAAASPSVWSNRYIAGVGFRGPRLLEQHDVLVEAFDLAVNADGRAVAWWIEREAGSAIKHVWVGEVP